MRYLLIILALLAPVALIGARFAGASHAGSEARTRPAVQPPESLILQGRRDPEEAAVSVSSIRYLPFDVPEGVTSITIHKELEHGPEDRGTVDHGLFDPRGHGPGGPGFRGWQGGMPADPRLAGGFAVTDSYHLAGPLPAGRWHLAQWFIRSAPAGLDYTYTITFGFDGPAPPAAMPAVPEYDPGVLRDEPGWYAGNLHAHTIHSDGTRPLDDLVALHERSGFDFLAITDHNTPRHHYEFARAAELHPDVLLLYGTEFTSPFGHANIVGQQPGHWFDFRINGGDGKLPQVIEAAHEQGAIFMINHPFAGCLTCLWRYPAEEWEQADAIEVWNGRWDEDDRRAVEFWDELLSSGRHVAGLGGSDYHRGDDPLTPAVMIYAQELSRGGIMEALEHGRAVLSQSPEGSMLYLTSADGSKMPGDTLIPVSGEPAEVRVQVVGGLGMRLRLVWHDGQEHGQREVAIEGDDVTVRHEVSCRSGENGYIRAELRCEDDAPAAMTNPLYISAAGEQ